MPSFWPFLVYPIVIAWIAYKRQQRKAYTPDGFNLNRAIDGEEAMLSITNVIYAAGTESERLRLVSDIVEAWITTGREHV